MKTPNQQIDRGESMAEMWAGFAAKLLPFAPPGSLQYEEMRKAFYAGGLCLFNWFMVQMEEGEEATDSDLNRVSLLQAELSGFFERQRPQA